MVIKNGTNNNDTIIGTNLADILYGNDGDDVLNGSLGADTMTGGTGNDTYYVDSTSDIVVENANEGIDTVISSISYILGNNLENLTLSGTSNINGTGNSSDNLIIGNAGNNIINGSSGSDTMKGGLGNDTYYVDNISDVISENLNQGTDIIISSISYILDSNIENLTLSGTQDINGTGNNLTNIITGNSGNNVLDGAGGNDTLNGGIGSDTMKGGTGNDTYYIDNVGDVIIENSNEGIDTVYSTVSYTMVDNVENLTLSGSAGTGGTGNDLNNIIVGNLGNNIIDGGIGADTMKGGLGNDTYYVDTLGDIIVENTNQGVDTVISSISFTLGSNLENLTLSGTSNINGTGNSLNNLISGNTGNNIINGGIGSDTMKGGSGDDTYYIDNISDVIIENADEGADTVYSTVSSTLSNNIENMTLTGIASINGTGNSLNNIIIGNSGNNIINGGIGADTMKGGVGSDTYYVDDSSDVIVENANEGTDTVISSISYTLGNNLENLTLSGSVAINATGNSLNNVINGNAGNNIIDGDVGADTMKGGAGDDTYYVDNVGDIIVENTGQGTDSVSSAISYILGANIENLTLTGNSNSNGTGNTLNNFITGNSGDNILVGNSGNDTLDGGIGADTLKGGIGNDTYYIDNVGDVIVENINEGVDTVYSSIDYALSSNLENMTLIGSSNINATGNNFNNVLIGNSGNNVLTGGAGNDIVDGRAGADTMQGGTGNDYYYIDDTNDAIIENLGEGTDSVFSFISYTLADNLENLTLSGSGDNNATGNALNNLISGNSGNNVLIGGAGADTMRGGAGDDTYYVDNIGDIVSEKADEGIDSVISTITLALGNNLENLELNGIDDIDGTGNALDNIITGNSGNNILDGGIGADTLIGGLGNDTYIIDDVNDVIVENTDEGADLVKSSVSFTLSNDIESLELTGTDNINGTGNELDNLITGNSGNNILDGVIGNDTLNGGIGADTLIGGIGDDTYVIDDVNDVIVENADEGSDFIKSSVTYTLSNDIENLELTGTNDINGTGNDLDNLITGNSGSNILDGGIGNDTIDGGSGADTLIGGLGDDNYLIDNINDVIVENADEGSDFIKSSVTYTLSSDIENLTLTGIDDINGTGNDLDNLIIGNDGSNILNGGIGADTLIGGIGDDTYIVDNINDIVTENSDEGLDLVKSSISYTLGSDLENLELIGTDDINGTGNELDNIITGNSGNNILDGGIGADLLTGGSGNDTYIVDDINDVVIENNNEGTDLVQSLVTFTLSNDVENLELTGTDDIDGTGNDLDNLILGNTGNNILDGDAGTDTLIGNLGDDTYITDNINDVIVENSDEGIDLVKSGVSYTLTDNLENLELTGIDDIDGTGNTLDNIITGNSGNNILDGDSGADLLTGRSGNDTYIVNDINDVVIENNYEGIDLVQSSVTYILSSDVENLTLTGTDDLNGTGNDLDNLIISNSGDNILDGGIGADTLIGGTGNDTYIIDDVNDIVTENTNEGTDLIQTSVTFILSSDVENLTLTGSDDINGTGNALDNIIIGNTGANILDGSIGNDTLSGGSGDDTYIVDDVNDVIVENSNEGVDLVKSGISYTLGSDIENLELTGVDDINGTGNDLDNTITGNSGNNYLDGNTGADTLIGGAGNDIYIVDNINDIVTENSTEGTDIIQSSITYTLASDVENLTLTGTNDINGTGNDLDNIIIGNTGANILDGSIGNDTLSGGNGNDLYQDAIGDETYLFNALDSIDTISDSDGNDTIKFESQVDKQNIAFFIDNAGKLYIDYGVASGNDQVIVNDWANSSSQIEKIQLNNNSFLTNNDINQIIQDMTTYASNNEITLNNIDDIKNSYELMNLFITNSWHS